MKKYQITVKINNITHGISKDFKDGESDRYCKMFLKVQMLKRLEKSLKFNYVKS